MPTNLPRIYDRDWVKNAFLAQNYRQDQRHRNAATFSTAETTFTDTRIGGSLCINPLPQFTRSADVRVRGLGPYGSARMGRYYHEAYEQHYQILHMRMGVPSFNSLVLFATNFYNSEAGRLARTGQGASIMYTLGKAAGYVVGILSWKIQAARLVGQAYQFFAQKGTSKFYTVKPTMPLYWNAVQTIVNQIAVNMGIVPRVGGENRSVHARANEQVIGPDTHRTLAEALPGLMLSSGSIDVYAVANRAQRLARRQMQDFENTVDALGDNQSMASAFAVFSSKRIKSDSKTPSHEAYLNSYFSTKPSGQTENSGEVLGDVSTAQNLQEAGDSFSKFLQAEFDDGSAFVSFRVNSTGTINESFSNTSGESELASKLNNMTSTARNLTFTFAKGNISDTVDSIRSGLVDMAMGAADSLGIGGIAAALTGGAFVDIPNVWRGSTARLPQSTYTIQLVSPYNHPTAQLMYVYMPLAMLLATALPLSTGKQSYTAPFICEYYDKGRAQSRLAIVDSLSVSRGTTNLPFNKNHRAMGVEVTLSLADLSSVIHMPISMGINLTGMVASGLSGAFGVASQTGIFDDDTVFTDYMATLSSLGLADQIYPLRRLKLNLTRELVKWDSMTSPARIANLLGDSFPGRMVSAFYAGTILE